MHAPTGTGKTYAVWLGVLADALQALWITPMRALANVQPGDRVFAVGPNCVAELPQRAYH